MTKIIRISKDAYDKLRELEAETGTSKQVLIEQALDKLTRETIIKKANQAYEKLKTSSAEWEEELQERALWDTTLSDNLNDV